MKRAIVLILDGVGIGELPDAKFYGDEGSNTLANLAGAVGGLNLPVLEGLGLGNIADISGVNKVPKPLASYAKMAERSPGKDSTSGHWELFGLILQKPFPTYPDGFPEEIIREFESKIGYKVLGNKPASGTEIIKELGQEHIRTKLPIVYTSADSVFQIATHIDVFSLEELYKFSEIAREILKGKYNVARVIARPFAGTAPNFYRTEARKDYSIPPPEPTLLDLTKTQGLDVVVIGKVDDIFAHRGYTRSYHSVINQECAKTTLKMMKEIKQGLIITNFIQFDMDWGHRNDIKGFHRGLIEIDGYLKDIVNEVTEGDLLFITADHGNDPTTPSTDHSREYVPLLAYAPKRAGENLGIRDSFADLAKTVARHLNVMGIKNGKDFYDYLS